MKKIILALLATQMAYAAPDQFPLDNYEYTPRLDQGMGKYASKSLRNTFKLALTYDDGPSTETTPQILDVLKEYNAKATFFVLTKNISSKTEPIIKRILDEGHILASHDHDHDNNNNESKSDFSMELKKSIQIIEELHNKLGFNPPEMYYRFPYGAYGTNKHYHHMNVMKEVSQEIYGENCINFAFWDIDTSDWVSNMNSADIAQSVRAYMEGGQAFTHKQVTLSNGKKTFVKSPYSISAKSALKGGVVLMHDIHAKNIKSTKLILEEAKEKGWEIVPLNEVEEYKYTPEKSCVPVF